MVYVRPLNGDVPGGEGADEITSLTMSVVLSCYLCSRSGNDKGSEEKSPYFGCKVTHSVRWEFSIKLNKNTCCYTHGGESRIHEPFWNIICLKGTHSPSSSEGRRQHGGRQIGKQFQHNLSEELPRAKRGLSLKELSLYRSCIHL